jgi:hypothetical protein
LYNDASKSQPARPVKSACAFAVNDGLGLFDAMTFS